MKKSASDHRRFCRCFVMTTELTTFKCSWLFVFFFYKPTLFSQPKKNKQLEAQRRLQTKVGLGINLGLSQGQNPLDILRYEWGVSCGLMVTMGWDDIHVWNAKVQWLVDVFWGGGGHPWLCRVAKEKALWDLSQFQHCSTFWLHWLCFFYTTLANGATMQYSSQMSSEWRNNAKQKTKTHVCNWGIRELVLTSENQRFESHTRKNNVDHALEQGRVKCVMLLGHNWGCSVRSSV